MKIYFILIFLFAMTTVHAKSSSTWVYNETKQELIQASEANTARPIASITKVMTALVALEYDSDMSKNIVVTSGSKLPAGINTRGDLFTAMLVRSDNHASEILASNYPGGRKSFIAAMNKKASDLGMLHARFVDPSGLGSGNVATVGEVATLIQVAALQPIIADISVLKEVEIKNKKYRVLLENTNKMLLASYEEIKFSKTGFTNAAGWNVAMILERRGQKFIVIILGAKNKVHRYEIAKSLIEKHFADIEYNLEQEKNKSFLQKLGDWFDRDER